MNRIFVACALLLSAPIHAYSQGGRLQEVRDEARPSNPSSTNNSTTDSSSSSSDRDSSSLLNAILAPFYAPIDLQEEDNDTLHLFAPHPYAHGYRGYLVPTTIGDDMSYERHSGIVKTKGWGVRVSLDDGNDFQGMNRLGGRLKFETASGIGLTANWSYFVEQLPSGGKDTTNIGDVNLTARYAEGAFGSAYVGLGVRALADEKQSDFGFNFTYGGDWFPVRPYVVSVNLDLGTLGSAWVVHLRGSIGVTYHGWEAFVGYDFLRVGSVNLQGPMAGVRWWF